MVQEFSKLFKKITDGLLEELATTALIAMQDTIPVDTGALRNSVTYEKTNANSYIVGHDTDRLESLSGKAGNDYGTEIYNNPSPGHKDWIEEAEKRLLTKDIKYKIND